MSSSFSSIRVCTAAPGVVRKRAGEYAPSAIRPPGSAIRGEEAPPRGEAADRGAPSPARPGHGAAVLVGPRPLWSIDCRSGSEDALMGIPWTPALALGIPEI